MPPLCVADLQMQSNRSEDAISTDLFVLLAGWLIGLAELAGWAGWGLSSKVYGVRSKLQGLSFTVYTLVIRSKGLSSIYSTLYC